MHPTALHSHTDPTCTVPLLSWQNGIVFLSTKRSRIFGLQTPVTEEGNNSAKTEVSSSMPTAALLGLSPQGHVARQTATRYFSGASEETQRSCKEMARPGASAVKATVSKPQTQALRPSDSRAGTRTPLHSREKALTKAKNPKTNQSSLNSGLRKMKLGNKKKTTSLISSNS